jgi:hypothetical protein
MKELLLIAGTVAAAMGLVAASVVVGGDTTTLVSPPGVVAKEFVRQLAAGRYDRAAAHLADSRGGREMAEGEGNRLRARAGEVEEIEGEESAIVGDTATASARIRTSRAGDLRARYILIRRQGSWKIAGGTESR